MILPILIGGVIWIWKGFTSKPNIGNNKPPTEDAVINHRKLKAFVIKTPLTEEQKKNFKDEYKKWQEEGTEMKIDKAAIEELK